jgi:hypothetical protein
MHTVYYNNVKYQLYGYEINWHKLHRDGDLPAYTSILGTKRWYKNGKCHRSGDKPAVIYGNGNVGWYKNDEYYHDFNLKNLIFLQSFIKILFHNKFNKLIWSPNNIAGTFTKKQLYKLVSEN